MSDTIKCTIKTPQHKDGKIHFWHTQSGELHINTFLFTPSKPKWKIWKRVWDHKVQFSSMEDFKKYQVR